MRNEVEQELDCVVNYAVSFTARLISLYRCHGSEWVFIRNAILSDGIQICRFEAIFATGNEIMVIFPVGLNPNKVPSYQQKFS